MFTLLLDFIQLFPLCEESELLSLSSTAAKELLSKAPNTILISVLQKKL